MRNSALAILFTLVLCGIPNASYAQSSCKLKLIRKPVPKLPKFVRGVRSDLMVHLQVRADGHVSQADLIRGTGNRDVDASVIEAIRHEWQYKTMRPECATVEEVITVKLQYLDRLSK